MILGTDVRLESPNPTPFIYQAKWKTWPIHILPISKIDPIHILFLKIDPIHILFFKFYPFIYFLGEKDTPLIYFWCKNDTHSYTGRPEKYTHSSRTSVYTFIMEVTPPWILISIRKKLFNMQLPFRKKNCKSLRHVFFFKCDPLEKLWLDIWCPPSGRLCYQRRTSSDV